jgi:phosphoglycolate phosphatase
MWNAALLSVAVSGVSSTISRGNCRLPPPFAVIFDLDGTLIDTAPDLLAAVNAVMAAEGRGAIELPTLRHLVGHGARTMLEHALLNTGPAVPPERLAQLVDDFLNHYRGNIAAASVPFPGVVETLEALKAQGAALGICSNKPHDMTELLLGTVGLTHFFGSIHGAGRNAKNKPDAMHLNAVIHELGASRDNSVMVGDSATDVAAARAVGVPVIVMSYGYTPVPPHELGGDAVTEDFRDVPALADRLLRARVM